VTRIVVCDDHHLLLEALSSALASRGFTVEAAVDTPDEAVRAVALHDPELLLIDLSFPSGSGTQAAREVIEHHPRTRVVMMTGAEDPETMLEALSTGISGYLAKNRPVQRIAEALHTVARGGTAFDEDLLRATRRAPKVPQQRRPLDSLTTRERRVLELLEAGMSTRQMVQTLGVSQSTVRTHVQNIFAKTGVHTRLQAVALLGATPAPPVTGSGRAVGR
jgi:two-component system nitrate/nitrite response regulator NarL